MTHSPAVQGCRDHHDLTSIMGIAGHQEALAVGKGWPQGRAGCREGLDAGKGWPPDPRTGNTGLALQEPEAQLACPPSLGSGTFHVLCPVRGKRPLLLPVGCGLRDPV